MDVRVDGADELRALAKRLKAAGRGDLRRELMRAAQRATRPVKAEVKASAIRTLPSKGGFGQWAARAKIVTRTRATGRSAGVVIKGSGAKNAPRADLRSLDRGRAMHPVFGRAPYVLQRVRPGFFSQVMDGPLTQRAAREFETALDEIARKLDD